MSLVTGEETKNKTTKTLLLVPWPKRSKMANKLPAITGLWQLRRWFVASEVKGTRCEVGDSVPDGMATEITDQGLDKVK